MLFNPMLIGAFALIAITGSEAAKASPTKLSPTFRPKLHPKSSLYMFGIPISGPALERAKCQIPKERREKYGMVCKKEYEPKVKREAQHDDTFHLLVRDASGNEIDTIEIQESDLAGLVGAA